MITLKITKLKKTFGSTEVFSNVSFEHRGNSLAIAGSNGSGKSTFLKCLGNLLNPTDGHIEWKQNKDTLSRKYFHQKLGYAAPYINLYDELSCRENLNFLSQVRHETSSAGSISRWIQKVKLKHVVDQPYGKLSTGQQQRLRLASALFHQPDILLLDEPGANLDEGGQTLLSDIAHSFQSADKMLIIASNNPDELDLCDRLFSIEREVFI